MKATLETQLAEASSEMSRMKGSDPLSRRRGAEQRYALAYDRLARMGHRPRLRRKYRP